MNKIVKSLVLCTGLSVAGYASANTDVKHTEQGEVVVTYKVSEAETAQGRKVLERKIRRAAKRVCGPTNIKEAGSISQVMDNRACVQQAVAKAMQDVKPVA